jgi:hypothetical protein
VPSAAWWKLVDPAARTAIDNSSSGWGDRKKLVGAADWDAEQLINVSRASSIFRLREVRGPVKENLKKVYR